MSLLVRELTGNPLRRSSPACSSRSRRIACQSRTCRCCRRSGCRSRSTRRGGTSRPRGARPMALRGALAGRPEPLVRVTTCCSSCRFRGVRRCGKLRRAARAARLAWVCCCSPAGAAGSAQIAVSSARRCARLYWRCVLSEARFFRRSPATAFSGATGVAMASDRGNSFPGSPSSLHIARVGSVRRHPQRARRSGLPGRGAAAILGRRRSRTRAAHLMRELTGSLAGHRVASGRSSARGGRLLDRLRRRLPRHGSRSPSPRADRGGASASRETSCSRGVLAGRGRMGDWYAVLSLVRPASWSLARRASARGPIR